MVIDIGDAIRLRWPVLVASGDPSNDLPAGTIGMVIDKENMTFDEDDPENSTEMMYLCLVNGIQHHLFETDIELINEMGEL